MASMPLELPNYDVLREKNIYSGSAGAFNYKLIPKDDQLVALVWYGKFCCEKSELAAQETFPAQPEGYETLKAWLDEQREIYSKSHHED